MAYDALEEFCQRLLVLDRSLRFVGIAHTEGKLLAYVYRPGILPLLTPHESEVSALQSLIRMKTRQSLEKKLGETVYSFTLYKKVKRVTIPLGDASNRLSHILMLSLEVNADHEPIVLNKVIPMLRELVL